MSRPRLLDLFCRAGGAAMGYYRAGFDVVGVDCEPQPSYPFAFVQGCALEFVREHAAGFAAIHASPPCQKYSVTRNAVLAINPANVAADLLAETRRALMAAGVPWVIENVPGAPMRADFRICGCHVGLWRLKRVRWFETSWRHFELTPPCWHPEPVITVAGHLTGKVLGASVNDWRRAMGIDWMRTRAELSQAIPPRYTEHIGRELLRVAA